MAYQYDKTGLVIQQTWGNGTATATTYDAASRPKRITLSKGGAGTTTTLNLTEYSFDAKTPGRVESRLAPALPHQTVHAVFPHTAFRCSSHPGMR